MNPGLGTGHIENRIRPFRQDPRRLDRGGLRTPVAQHGGWRGFACSLLIDQIFQRDRIEVFDHLLVQRGPEFVRHAVAVALLRAFARALAAALRGIERLVDGDDDVGHRDVFRAAREIVTAARTAHGFDDLVTAQLPEQLFEIRQGDVLALADTRKRHRALLLAQCQVNHRRDGETAFRGESHDVWEPQFSTSLLKYKYMSYLVKYPCLKFLS